MRRGSTPSGAMRQPSAMSAVPARDQPIVDRFAVILAPAVSSSAEWLDRHEFAPIGHVELVGGVLVDRLGQTRIEVALFVDLGVL